MSPGLLVISDLHWGGQPTPAADERFRQLVTRHPERTLVLAGDAFELSQWLGRGSSLRALDPILLSHPTVRAVLAERLQRGGEVVLVAGNHDAALAEEGGREAVVAALGLTGDVPLQICPWYFRVGAVHIEHGHRFDPDNAPIHPLCPPSQDTEPLGVVLTRRLLTPLAAERFAHEHETTPLRALANSFRRYGLRAPRLIATYFAVAAGIVRRAACEGEAFRQEWRRGEGRRAQLADAELAALWLKDSARPRHSDPVASGKRLYLDRSAACIGWAGACFAWLLGASATWLWVGGACFLLLAASVLLRRNRYAGELEVSLRGRACALVAVTPATSLVVLGHSHAEDQSEGYVNVGSFAFPRGGAGALLVDENGAWRRATASEDAAAARSPWRRERARDVADATAATLPGAVIDSAAE